MKEELDKARKISCLSTSDASIDQQSWSKLFEDESFFLNFKNYMQIICASDTEDHQNIWLVYYIDLVAFQHLNIILTT